MSKLVIAVYLRLSKEDDKLQWKHDESNSIINQRKLIHTFIKKQEDLKSLEIREYVDDGFSGKNFERPGVTKLIEDVKNMTVSCIVVKDLSRFGRDYLEVGNYIEKIFPFMGVRFIAINNHFDSQTHAGSVPNMDVSFQNLMYDYFSRETSEKVKKVQRYLRKKGMYLATEAPYGYQKDPKNKHHLIVDKEAAETIRLIFRLYSQSHNKSQVARMLNEGNFPTSSQYILKRKNRKWGNEDTKTKWNATLVGRIIYNQVYIGNMVSGKEKVTEVGSGKIIPVPEKNWLIVEGTHESIIDKELFDSVQGKCFVRSKEISKEKRPLSGLIRCGGCLHSMSYVKRGNSDNFYRCPVHHELHSDECYSERLSEQQINEIVLNEINNQISMAKDIKTLLEKKELQIKNEKRRIEEERQQVIFKITSARGEFRELFEKYKKGEMDRKAFLMCKERNNKDIEMLNATLNKLEKAMSTDVDNIKTNPFLLNFGRDNELKELSNKVAKSLIEGIYVYDDNRIEIRFKFRDEYEQILK